VCATRFCSLREEMPGDESLQFYSAMVRREKARHAVRRQAYAHEMPRYGIRESCTRTKVQCALQRKPRCYRYRYLAVCAGRQKA